VIQVVSSMIKRTFAFISRHERSLSAASMIGGFAFDNYAVRHAIRAGRIVERLFGVLFAHGRAHRLVAFSDGAGRHLSR
jgi:hypothetical protein